MTDIAWETARPMNPAVRWSLPMAAKRHAKKVIMLPTVSSRTASHLGRDEREIAVQNTKQASVSRVSLGLRLKWVWLGNFSSLLALSSALLVN